MIPTAQAWFDAAAKLTSVPLCALRLTPQSGQYVYGNVAFGATLLPMAASPIADGSYLADGSITAGSQNVGIMGYGRRLQSLSPIRESLVPTQGQLLASLSESEATTATVQLANTDQETSDLNAQGLLIGAEAEVLIGFQGLGLYEFMPRFKGRVSKVSATRENATLTLEAV